ncbi:hypothetical protein NQ317_016081 [Molorchus minor]|uniref:Reverse transcriptase n=1 Tax=Molorchus minor TaxID=1323400 RepID=A0ABQ9ITV1_9CUCU|nr:hypothetical protein NQ317_016081 [Molorchus minor]
MKRVVKKEEVKAAILSQVMPNIGGPSSQKRSILNGVVQSIVLYGAPVWQRAMHKKRYRAMVDGVQRKSLLRVASAYRTVSVAAVQVVTATPPLSLLAEERTYLYETQNGHQPEIRQVARERTICRWQTEWEENTVTAQWTKRLIPVLDGWVKCKHRSTDYFLTQALTGHGPFRSYRTRIGKIEDERCLHCGTVDTVEHTLFECNRWEIYRQETYGELGLEISAENMTREMTASESKWKIIQRMVNKILREKEQEERG